MVSTDLKPNGVKGVRFFHRSAGLLLLFTGAAKLASGFGNARILKDADPVFGMKFGHLMIAASAIELAIATVCIFRTGRVWATALIAWLATGFLVYRIGLYAIGWYRPCPCLGNLTDALHISPQLADNAMKVVLAYLLAGSYWILIRHWRSSRENTHGTDGVRMSAAEIKT